MTRKEKRALRKDKSLIYALYNFIDKYLPRLFIMFKNLSDKRQISKITYSKKSINDTRLVISSSFTRFNFSLWSCAFITKFC